MVTRERLREVLHYEPATGRFTWIKALRRGWIGKPAGRVCNNGYLQIGIDGELYSAHRLAWLYVTGELPPETVDHKNLDKLDNRWGNLRAATVAQNSRNRMPPKPERGFTGAYRANQKWRARIKLNGRMTHLGTFETPELAAGAYAAAAKEHYGEFARVA